MIRNYIVLHPDPHVLKYVRVLLFSPKNHAHIRLSELSESAHKAAGKGDAAGVKRIEEEVDRWAAKVWGLTDQELREIKASLAEM